VIRMIASKTMREINLQEEKARKKARQDGR
jgi:hypothetical protein